jgi:mono/diheme cytochrome c family protein
MPLGLTTTSQVALGVMAGIFIVFSLLSSFVFPKRNPDFPGKKWRNAYLVVCAALFLAMMATVLIWGKEPEEAGAHGGGEPTHTTPGETTPGETTPGETTPGETTPGETTPGGTTPGETTPAGGGGDAAAGKQVFLDNCGVCHELQDAGTSGAVGPNLDETQSDEALIRDRVENGKGAMPAFKDQLTPEQIDDVVAYVHETTSA